MRIQNRVIKGQIEGDAVQFLLDNNAEGPNGIPAGKMITDSDEIAFVYLMDQEEGYTYIHFPRETWALMARALQAESDPTLLWTGGEMKLVGFKEELAMLVYNIEGNDNYGEAFTQAVEHEFEAFLQHQGIN